MPVNVINRRDKLNNIFKHPVIYVAIFMHTQMPIPQSISVENTRVMERATSSNSHLTSTLKARKQGANSTLVQADGENRKA